MQPGVQESRAAAGGELIRAPVYLQLNRLLRDLIRRGEFRPGQQFLSERDVSRRFGVSRVTANKSLSQLVMGGDLDFRKGIGTFVRDGRLEHDLQSLVSFTRKAEAAGKKPMTRVLSFSATTAADATAEVRDALRLSVEDPLVYFERLRLADGIPFILERRHVSARLCPGLTRRRVAGSLYALFTGPCGLAVTSASQSIRAVNLAPGDAARLAVPPGSAALRVRAVGWVPEGPLWFEDTLYRGDLYEFRNELGESAGARPARLIMCERVVRNTRHQQRREVPCGRNEP